MKPQQTRNKDRPCITESRRENRQAECQYQLVVQWYVAILHVGPHGSSSCSWCMTQYPVAFVTRHGITTLNFGKPFPNRRTCRCLIRVRFRRTRNWGGWRCRCKGRHGRCSGVSVQYRSWRSHAIGGAVRSRSSSRRNRVRGRLGRWRRGGFHGSKAKFSTLAVASFFATNVCILCENDGATLNRVFFCLHNSLPTANGYGFRNFRTLQKSAVTVFDYEKPCSKPRLRFFPVTEPLQPCSKTDVREFPNRNLAI